MQIKGKCVRVYMFVLCLCRCVYVYVSGGGGAEVLPVRACSCMHLSECMRVCMCVVCLCVYVCVSVCDVMNSQASSHHYNYCSEKTSERNRLAACPSKSQTHKGLNRKLFESDMKNMSKIHVQCKYLFQVYDVCWCIICPFVT